MVRTGSTWVSVDTSLPGKLFHQAVAAGSCAPFAGYTEIRPEYRYGGSRIDFLLTAPDLPPCLVEVKSVTSVLPDADGVRVARFPDVPTARGARHLGELAAAVREGYRAAVCFIASGTTPRRSARGTRSIRSSVKPCAKWLGPGWRSGPSSRT